MGNRVAMVITTLGASALRALPKVLEDRSSSRTVLIRRPSRCRHVTSIATIGTGNLVHRHDVHTSLVPVEDGMDVAPSGAMAEARLRMRTFRDSGVPFIWDRLASRDVPSAALGFPFATIGEGSSLVEHPFPAIYGATGPRPEAMLAAFVKLQEGEIGHRLVAGWLPIQKSEEADDIDLGDRDASEDATTDEPTASIAEAQGFVRFMSEFRDRVEAEHCVWVVLGPRYGYLVVDGPRAMEIESRSMMEFDVAPTVLDLLDERLGSFIRGKSILVPSSDGGDIETTTTSWDIEEVPTASADMRSLIESVVEGDRNPLRVKVAVTYLRSKFWCCISDGYLDAASAAAADIVAVQPSETHLFWNLILAAMMRDEERMRGLVDWMRRDYPESSMTRMIPALPGMNTDEKELADLLGSEIDPRNLPPICQGLWGRNAIRLGMIDRGIDVLKDLFKTGYAFRVDLVTLAGAYVKRNGDGDMDHARSVLAVIPNVTFNQDGSVNPRVLLLRATALSRAGENSVAIRMLEKFLADHPMEGKATRLLEQLRSSEGAQEES